MLMLHTVKLYLNGMGGTHPYLFWVVYLGALFVSEVTIAVQTWFLGYWAQQYEDHDPSEVHAAAWDQYTFNATVN